MCSIGVLKIALPWLIWVHGLSTGLWTKKLLFQFPVGAQAWVVGQDPDTNPCFSPLFPSLHFSLKIRNKCLFKKWKFFCETEVNWSGYTSSCVFQIFEFYHNFDLINNLHLFFNITGRHMMELSIDWRNSHFLIVNIFISLPCKFYEQQIFP